MPGTLAHSGLSPSAYVDPAILEQERVLLFRSTWQWVGLTEGLRQPGGITATLAGLSIAVEGEQPFMRVSVAIGQRRQPLPGAVADICGRFVFVRLSADGPDLLNYLDNYADILKHCSEYFDEVYDDTPYDWACNWKAGIESLLEGYHVAYVHGSPPATDEEPQEKSNNAANATTASMSSNLAAALPGGDASTFSGPHSYQRGYLGEGMKQEMATIAKRLKLAPSPLYTEYDQFTLFPNMIIGMAGGCLCFMHIFDPMTSERTQMRNIYLLARPADATQQPSPLIKAGLLAKWRDYNATVIGEDRLASERRQIGMQYANKPGYIGHIAEERVAHFHSHWRAVMDHILQPSKVA